MTASTTQTIKIGERRVGRGEPVYIVAEMSANHSQDFQTAVALVRAAKASGADAIKVQTYTADTITIDSDAEPFRIKKTLWEGKTLHQLYGEAHTPWDWQPQLQEVARDEGLDFFSTPFDATAVDFLEDLHVPAHKIASFEIVDIPLLTKIAGTGKPVIMSTGMATLAEIDEAMSTLRAGGAREIALLKCTSAYPAPAQEANLRTIPHLAAAFGVTAGLSDHTMGVAVPVAAVALGACIIEKHFTLSRSKPGPDSGFSLEPGEFREMVDAVRAAESALGDVHFGLTHGELENRVFRRSLFVVQDVKSGELFTPQNVRSIRPGYGLHTRHLVDIIGRRARGNVTRGTPLSWELVQ